MKRIYSAALMAVSAAGFALAVANSGCSDKSDAAVQKNSAESSTQAAFKGSCNNIKLLSTCTDYNDQAYTLGEGFIKSACEATSGVYSTTPCPPVKMVGSCHVDGGQTRKYYSDGMIGYKAGDAEKDCKDLYSGKWAMK
jgi:hypothetical protein